MKPARLQTARVQDDTATRIGYSIADGYAAITVFDASDATTIAQQMRAFADRIDPPTNRSIRTTPAKRRHRASRSPL